VLGGILVGSAAQGEEQGEERPLIIELVRKMRKWCIPSESSPQAWRMVQQLQPVMIKEVAAFENMMKEMGFMDVNANSIASRIGKSSAASSPSGLSVLVNPEMSSPIKPSANETLSNISRMEPLDLASPVAAGLSEYDKTTQSQLSELANSFIQAYIEDQRSQILNKGRSILLCTDYHNAVKAGKFVDDPSEPGSPASLDDNPLSPFLFPQCSISTTAQQMYNLVRKTLDDASHPNLAHELEALPPVLYRASRELLDLFRIIIPTQYASEVASIPRTAALLHNDCVFLAHEASLLGAEYKGKFNSFSSSKDADVDDNPGRQNKMQLLSGVCTFVDSVPPFRDLATKSMGAMIELQKSQLYELVSPRLANFERALCSNESVSEWDDAETALSAALYHLRHLSQAWSQVLSRGVYHLAMGNLVDTVFSLFLDLVLTAEAITDPASRFVHSLFLDAARGAAEMFLVGAPTSDVTMSMDTQQNMDERFKIAHKYATLFDKLNAIGQFMIMRLDDVQRGLEEGLFRSVKAKELAHLVDATFDESDKRKSLLKALAATK